MCTDTSLDKPFIFKSPQALEAIAPYLQKISSPIIVEAGAYKGADTVRMAERFANSIIHAFEPVPELFSILQDKTAHLPSIKRYECALSDREGSALLHVAEKAQFPGRASQASSLLAPKERLSHSPIIFPRTMTVRTTTLDSWMEVHKIDRIDMLWLDLQGPELAVMRSSPRAMSTVSIVFTEVSFIESYAGQPQYQEVKAWLENEGFCMVGRDFENTTDWFFGNVLFVRT